jgi:hypothetical protein
MSAVEELDEDDLERDPLGPGALVRQTPVVGRAVERSAVKSGARITVRWPDS